MEKELLEILVENIDEEILDKMPEWFKVLKNAYRDKKIF